MRTLTTLAASLLLFAGTAATQAPGSYRPFGRSGLFEPVHNPGIEASAAPRVGGSFTVKYTGTFHTFSNTLFLITGHSNTTWGGRTLPLALDPRWFARTSLTPGTSLLVSMDAISYSYASYPNTHHGVTFKIPNTPILAGQVFYQQWVVISQGGVPVQNFLQLSCGAVGTIGR